MDVVANVQEIIRSEFRLATTEMKEDLARLGAGAALAGGAAIALVLAVAFLLGGAMFGLATVLPLWASALIVGGATAVVGAALLGIALRQLRTAGGLKPVKTIDSIRETAEWAKDRTR